MTTTLPQLSTLPSAQWRERVRDGLTDLDPVLDSILVWIKGEWLPAQLDHATTRTVTVAVYDWVKNENGLVHIDDVPVADRPEPLREHFRAPVAHVARRHRDRGPRPGRPKIGPKIGPYPVPPVMHDLIVAYQHNEGYGTGHGAQAAAVRDLLAAGLRGPWPLPAALAERVQRYQTAEQFDTLDETILYLLDDALTAANY